MLDLDKSNMKDIVLITTSDGNHGAGLAWVG